MYLTVKETAEYLSCTESAVKKMIHEKKIRALYDGSDYMINKEQFETHLKQMEKYMRLVEEVKNEPLPEDIDIKDED